MNKAVGEVIESSLQRWLVQSWQWDACAPFGSLVVAQSTPYTVYGIVCAITTGSMDPTRYPFAYQKTEQELREEQPQIFEFLKTTFSCITVGYEHKGTIHYRVCPQPPNIHSFVAPAPDEIATRFLSNHHFLHILFSAAPDSGSLDELMLAVIDTMKSLSLLSEDKTHRLLQTFSLLTGNDYRRLKLFLQRAQRVIQL